MKLLIHSKNSAIHSAALDFRITFNETDSLDSQTKNDEKQKVCLEGIGVFLCRAWELSNCDSNKHNTDMTDKEN